MQSKCHLYKFWIQDNFMQTYFIWLLKNIRHAVKRETEWQYTANFGILHLEGETGSIQNYHTLYLVTWVQVHGADATFCLSFWSIARYVFIYNIRLMSGKYKFFCMKLRNWGRAKLYQKSLYIYRINLILFYTAT